MLQRLIDIKTDATAAFEKEGKQLLVRLDEDLILLALTDKVSGSWHAAEILKAEAHNRAEENFFQQLKQSSTLVNYRGMETQVLLSTSQSMAVPAALAEDISLFFETQFGGKYPDIQTDTVNENIVFPFVPQPWQLEVIARFFPEARRGNTLALLTQQALLNPQEENTYLYLHIGSTYAEFVLIQHGQLFINRYLFYATPADLLYQLLNTARHLNIQPASLSVQLQGFITDEDEIYHLLTQYFAPVGFAKNASPILHEAFRKVPPHFFTGLMLPV